MTPSEMQSGTVPAQELSPPTLERVYSNQGNTPLISLLDQKFARVLDVGCGAGDNAALIKARNWESEVFGITHSPAEAVIAKALMAKCWVADIEDELPGD